MDRTQFNTIRITKLITFLCVIVLFLLSWAVNTGGANFLGTSHQKQIIKIVVVLCVAAIVLMCQKIKLFNQLEITAIVGLFLYRLINIFYAYDYKGIGLTTLLIGFVICLQTDEIRSDVFCIFKYIMVAEAIIGIVCFISFYLHLGIPYTMVERGGGTGWINYKLCYLMYQNNGLIRINGLFDEPGWFGTWAAFFLCAEGIDLRKKENIILLVAGLLTFSLAFMMLLVIYFILNNLSDWKRWIWVIVLGAVYLFVLPNVETGYSSIDNILQRMVITKEGLAGSNRYGSLFEGLWDRTIHSSRVLWGYGAGYAELYGTGLGQGLASIKSYVVNFGIIGTAIIFGPVFFASVKHALNNKNRLMLFYVLITFISLYQRPYFFEPPHIILFMCAMSYTYLKEPSLIVENEHLHYK